MATPVSPSPSDWRSYLGEDTRTHYSPLAQIAPANVAQLERVWEYRSASAAGARPGEGNPLVIGGRLFTATRANQIVALDAATGAEQWRFHPAAERPEASQPEGTTGLAFWSNGEESRLFFVSHRRVGAVAPQDGKPIAGFGRDGFIDLPAQSSERGGAAPTTFPTVLRDLVIVGGAALNAYDARSGAPVWQAEPGCDGVIATDAAAGHLYCIAGQFLRCLDARNGHEIWRRELSAEHAPVTSPVLLTLRRNGESVPAVVCATRAGRALLFHRITGEPLAASAGFSVIPPEDAQATTGAPVADPNNRVFLAARGRAFAAVDLAAGDVAWRTHPRMDSAGGDPIVTGSGLVFRGTKEGLHANDANTGMPLWRGELPAEQTGTPATYFAAGRQFVVIPAGDSLVAFALPAKAIATPAPEARAPERFETDIRRLETQASQNPQPHGIVFLGSSTFTRWDIGAVFPNLPVLNFGFGGSRMPDLNHYAARLLLPVRPRLLVFYGGSNDIGAYFSPEEVARGFREFASWMEANLPECDVLVLGNLPTPSRWTIWPRMHELNTLLAAETRRHPRQHYLDGASVMLDPDGHLRRDRISSDNLHLNAEGNAALGDLLRPAIEAIIRQPAARD